MSKSEVKTQQIGVRVDERLLNRIEEQVRKEREARPGSHITISDIVRESIIRGMTDDD